jgi:hypothetical protein
LIVSSSTTRCGRLLSAVEALRRDGRLGEKELLVATGGVVEANEVVGLLLSLGFAESAAGVLTPRGPLEGPLTPEQRSAVEAYSMGAEEAADFRRLMDAFGTLPPEAPQEPGPQPKGAEPDPEALKRFAKSFLDVADIAARQKVVPKAGGR